MTETDADFQKALHADKIMSLSDDSHGAGTEFGTVGYDKKRKGQLLLFPRSLKAFEGMKIVGIKYDLFSEDPSSELMSKKEPKAKKSAKKKSKGSPAKKSLSSQVIKKTEKPPPAKVIHFPKPKVDEDDEDESVRELKGYARQAMRALEKNNSVSAYNLLKRIIGHD